MCFCFKKLLNSVRDSHWNHNHGLIHREKKTEIKVSYILLRYASSLAYRVLSAILQAPNAASQNVMNDDVFSVDIFLIAFFMVGAVLVTSLIGGKLQGLKEGNRNDRCQKVGQLLITLWWSVSLRNPRAARQFYSSILANILIGYCTFRIFFKDYRMSRPVFIWNFKRFPNRLLYILYNYNLVFV